MGAKQIPIKVSSLHSTIKHASSKKVSTAAFPSMQIRKRMLRRGSKTAFMLIQDCYTVASEELKLQGDIKTTSAKISHLFKKKQMPQKEEDSDEVMKES